MKRATKSAALSKSATCSKAATLSVVIEQLGSLAQPGQCVAKFPSKGLIYLPTNIVRQFGLRRHLEPEQSFEPLNRNLSNWPNSLAKACFDHR